MGGLPPGIVEAAVYYVVKADSRTKGFYLKESSGNLFEIESRLRNQLSNEQKQELFTSIRQLMNESIRKIKAGEFAPVPKNISSCEECAWDRLCRAPHLN